MMGGRTLRLKRFRKSPHGRIVILQLFLSAICRLVHRGSSAGKAWDEASRELLAEPVWAQPDGIHRRERR